MRDVGVPIPQSSDERWGRRHCLVAVTSVRAKDCNDI